MDDLSGDFTAGGNGVDNLFFCSAAPVSKYHEQSNAVQAKALHDADYCRIFEKAASGAGWDRPELHRMHRQLRPPVVID